MISTLWNLICKQIAFIYIVCVPSVSCAGLCMLLLLLLLLVNSLSGLSEFVFQSSKVLFFKCPAVLLSIPYILCLNKIWVCACDNHGSFVFQLLEYNYRAACWMCSLAGHFGPRSTERWSTRDHWQAQTLEHTTFQSAAQVYCLSCESQNCSRKAPWDSLSAAKVSEASFWPKVNTPEYTLAWLNMDEPLIGPRGLLFLALSFFPRIFSLLLSHPDAWMEGVLALVRVGACVQACVCASVRVCERVCSCVYMQRCVVAHMRDWGRLFVFSNILHCVWRVVLEQQEQELNNFPNGYLLTFWKYVLSLPIPHRKKSLSLL